MPPTQQVQLCPHTAHRSSPHEHATSSRRAIVYERTPGTPSMYTASNDGLWGKGAYVTAPDIPRPVRAGDRVRFVESYRAANQQFQEGDEVTCVRRGVEDGRFTMVTLRSDTGSEFAVYEHRVEHVQPTAGSPVGTEITVGTEIPGGALDRSRHEGLTLRCTARAAYDGARYFIGCQRFSADELLSRGGSISAIPGERAFTVQFDAKIENGMFKVSGRDDQSVREANTHVIQSVVTQGPVQPVEPAVRVVEAQPRLYSCSAHGGSHIFLMQPVGAEGREVTVARVEMRDGRISDAFENSSVGFTQWPDCRPTAGPNLIRLAGGSGNDRRHVQVTDDQLRGNVVVGRV